MVTLFSVYIIFPPCFVFYQKIHQWFNVIWYNPTEFWWWFIRTKMLQCWISFTLDSSLGIALFFQLFSLSIYIYICVCVCVCVCNYIYIYNVKRSLRNFLPFDNVIWVASSEMHNLSKEIIKKCFFYSWLKIVPFAKWNTSWVKKVKWFLIIAFLILCIYFLTANIQIFINHIYIYIYIYIYCIHKK